MTEGDGRPSVHRRTHLRKKFGKKQKLFAECSTSALGKYVYFSFNNFFVVCPIPSTRQNFYFYKKNLSRVPYPALGKDFF